MHIGSGAPARAVWRDQRKTSSIIHLALTLALAIIVGVPSLPQAARADDAPGTPNGNIYHRKGWTFPAIYRRPAKVDDNANTGPATAPQARSSATDKATTKNRNSKRTVSKPRRIASARRGSRRRHRKLIKRTIPPRVVKQQLAPEQKKTAPWNNEQYARRVASLGFDILTLPRQLLTGDGALVRWVASSRCLPGRLRKAISYVARNFGRVRVNSTCRSPRHNRRVGGARLSWHLKGRAADIRVFGNIRKAARYLRRVVGGFKHYGGGLFHIDTGPRRTW